MSPGLLAVVLLPWLAALLCGWWLARRLAGRGRAAALLFLAAAALLASGAAHRHLKTARARQQFDRHYQAAIDELERGNLDAARESLEHALAVRPGDPEARRRLEGLRRAPPAEKREQSREAAVDLSAAPGSGAPAARERPGPPPRPAAHRPSPFEIVHYALDLELDPAAHSLAAEAAIRVRSRGAAVPVLEFSLNPEFRPTAAAVDGVPAPFKHGNDQLAVTPSRPLPAGGAALVTVRYARSGPADVRGGDRIAADGTYLRSEARWYPATGELDFRSPVRVRARVPRGYAVVSAGSLRGIEKDARGARFHWESDRPAAMVSLAAARYAQQSVLLPPPGDAGRGPLKITCYTFPRHRARAAPFLKEAAAIVRFYERHFGPYPYEKLAVAEIPVFPGGYGSTSLVMLVDAAFAERKLDREFLAHEIAHQWWGNSVFPQGPGAAWLSEGFANYSAWMYAAAAAGNPRVLPKRVARASSRFFRETAARGDQAIYETDPYRPVGAREAILYEKGAVVLHMLRRHLGDAAFRRALRAFADRHRYGKAKIEDFRAAAERESGQELDWFFDQWLGRTGGMRLTYRFATLPDTPLQNQAVLTLSQAGEPYRAKMKVVLDVENAVRTHEIELGRAEQEFRFPVRGRLTNVLIEPETGYLMPPPRWAAAEPPERAAGVRE